MVYFSIILCKCISVSSSDNYNLNLIQGQMFAFVFLYLDFNPLPGNEIYTILPNRQCWLFSPWLPVIHNMKWDRTTTPVSFNTLHNIISEHSCMNPVPCGQQQWTTITENRMAPCWWWSKCYGPHMFTSWHTSVWCWFVWAGVGLLSSPCQDHS